MRRIPISQAVSMATLLLLGVCAAPGMAEPQPGDVFREYGVPSAMCIIDGNSVCTYTTPAVDLADAIKAELVAELANPHITHTVMTATINGSGTPVTLPWPAAIPEPQTLYYMWAVITVPLPSLDVLKAGAANTFGLRCKSVGGTTNMGAWNNCYGVTLRIYYDPAKKAHPTGTVAGPAAGSQIGRSVSLSVNAQAGSGGTLDRVDYIGNYEDIDVNGNGVFKEWVYSYSHAKLIKNMASGTGAPDYKATWNTEWVPDQAEPVLIAARIVDKTGLIYMTPTVSATLYRSDLSVELCKSYNIPHEFHPATFCYHETGCKSSQTTNFKVNGDLSKLIDARITLRIWWHDNWWPIKINGTQIDLKVYAGAGPYVAEGPLKPTSALRSGENVNLTQASVNYPDGVFIMWPTFQYLLRYSSPTRTGGAVLRPLGRASVPGVGRRGMTLYGVDGRRAPVRSTGGAAGVCLFSSGQGDLSVGARELR